MKIKLKSKRHILLLEVLIAFALVVLCAMPLIYPHVAVLQEQKKFIKKIELDRVVSLLFAEQYELLYRNEISWEQIDSKRVEEISSERLQELNQSPLPFKGSYFYEEINHKPKKPEKTPPFTLFFIKLTFMFIPQNLPKLSEEEKLKKAIVYEYKIFVTRDNKLESEEETTTKTDKIGDKAGKEVVPQKEKHAAVKQAAYEDDEDYDEEDEEEEEDDDDEDEDD